MNETRFVKITRGKPSDLIFGKSGAVAYAIGDEIEVLCRNPMTKEVRSISLPISFKDGFLAWVNGAMIQESLPYLSIDGRELLISGM
jgi:hypothetical protein